MEDMKDMKDMKATEDMKDMEMMAAHRNPRFRRRLREDLPQSLFRHDPEWPGAAIVPARDGRFQP